MATSVAQLRREINEADSDSPLLSPVEKTALALCAERARRQQPITQLDLTIAVGSGNWTGSTAAGILNRLERKGYIERTYYQRGVQVCIVETGECTAPPTNQATHWRDRDEPVQTPPIHELRKYKPHATTIIEREAAASGKAMHDFLQDLVFNGLELWLDRRADQ